jgi:hypothetical protein
MAAQLSRGYFFRRRLDEDDKDTAPHRPVALRR